MTCDRGNVYLTGFWANCDNGYYEAVSPAGPLTKACVCQEKAEEDLNVPGTGTNLGTVIIFAAVALGAAYILGSKRR